MTIDAIQAQFIGNNKVLPTYGSNLLEYITNNNLSIDELPIFISDFAQATIECLDNRIFDPEQLPKLDSDLANYEFKPLLNNRTLINEWGIVKFFLKNYRSIKFVDAWNLIFSKTSFLYDFPATSTLIQIALIIPVTNAAVERVFSRQNLIKTHLRNQMNINTLNDYLMIALNGPPIELFDFEKAFDYC
ncbi:8025_t:CDS:2 [Gigaspora margarita]|uniref:8025_t:CDS:1 n=1 Tax=Gigaspora margarita TaxID=4874 RepID=A0ABN7V387_GIGMA|nr:8025_t:CDS:2 [Gigaspora margarita]